MPNIYLMWNPFLFLPPHFMGILFPSQPVCTVKSRAVGCLGYIVAHSRIFRLFMKGKFDAYLLWPLAKKFQLYSIWNTGPTYHLSGLNWNQHFVLKTKNENQAYLTFKLNHLYVFFACFVLSCNSMYILNSCLYAKITDGLEAEKKV